MKSGLEGRNKHQYVQLGKGKWIVSMKSGLEGRNKPPSPADIARAVCVSMKSGLEGRNNRDLIDTTCKHKRRLNEVRPRRPEQLTDCRACTRIA